MDYQRYLIGEYSGSKYYDFSTAGSLAQFEVILKQMTGPKVLILRTSKELEGTSVLAQLIEDENVIHVLMMSLITTDFAGGLAALNYDFISDYSSRGTQAAVEAATALMEPGDSVIYGVVGESMNVNNESKEYQTAVKALIG